MIVRLQVQNADFLLDIGRPPVLEIQKIADDLAFTDPVGKQAVPGLSLPLSQSVLPEDFLVDRVEGRILCLIESRIKGSAKARAGKAGPVLIAFETIDILIGKAGLEIVLLIQPGLGLGQDFIPRLFTVVIDRMDEIIFQHGDIGKRLCLPVADLRCFL